MQETEKLFDRDAYAEEFSAEVRSAEYIAGKKKRLWKVILDRTLFFPEEGGQTPDTGMLNGFPVVDVQLAGNVICHYVQAPAPESDQTAVRDNGNDQEECGGIHNGNDRENCDGIRYGNDQKKRGSSRPLFAPGEMVEGRIDFTRRFSNMQNHSGEHILSGLTHNRFGYDNVGFHLSDNTVTLDFNGPLSDEDILWLEREANRVVWDNKEIRGWYPDAEELEQAVYRSKKEIDGPLRLVEIPGVDLCACCAPHVHRTGEIGLIKIIRTLRERSGIRLTILCGSRALAYMQTLQKAAEEVSHLTNMPREEIADGVSRILEDNEKLRMREAALENQVTEALAATVPADQEHVFLFTPGTGGTDGAGIGNLAQRRLVNTLCASRSGYCGVFAGDEENGYRYIIGAGSMPDKGIETGTNPVSSAEADARVLNACLHKYCRARGGGKPAMVQGSVKATEAEIREALRKALCELAES